jgi:hypothetical protein
MRPTFVLLALLAALATLPAASASIGIPAHCTQIIWIQNFGVVYACTENKTIDGYTVGNDGPVCVLTTSCPWIDPQTYGPIAYVCLTGGGPTWILDTC